MMLSTILALILYIVMGIFIGIKQAAASNFKHDKDDANIAGFFAGIFWPIVLTYYIIRVVFFEDWI